MPRPYGRIRHPNCLVIWPIVAAICPVVSAPRDRLPRFHHPDLGPPCPRYFPPAFQGCPVPKTVAHFVVKKHRTRAVGQRTSLSSVEAKNPFAGIETLCKADPNLRDVSPSIAPPTASGRYRNGHRLSGCAYKCRVTDARSAVASGRLDTRIVPFSSCLLANVDFRLGFRA